MTGPDRYPDDVAGPFPDPPRRFEDREGRSIEIRAYDGDGGTDSDGRADVGGDEGHDSSSSDGEEARDSDGREARDCEDEGARDSDDARAALKAMYEEFDPADRAQGLPPSRPSQLDDWLDRILDPECYNVLAWYDDAVIGHATLVPEGGPDDPYELAIFVHQPYQGAGIGTHLMQALLGHGAASGVTRVWLTVERWNRAAVGLYKKIGFETADAENFEMEMAIRLAPELPAE